MNLIIPIRDRYELSKQLWWQGAENFAALCKEYPIVDGFDPVMDYLETTIDDSCEAVQLNDFLWYEFDTIEQDMTEQYS